MSIFLVLISFSLINAYAGTLTVNLVNEENPTTLTAFVTGTAIPGTRADEQFNTGRPATFDNVNTGSYGLSIINENNQVFTVDIENPEWCDNLIASNDDDEMCQVSLDTDINDALGTPIGGGFFGIKIDSSIEAFKTTTAAELMREDEKNDPPFRACKGFEITDDVSTPVTKFIRSP